MDSKISLLVAQGYGAHAATAVLVDHLPDFAGAMAALFLPFALSRHHPTSSPTSSLVSQPNSSVCLDTLIRLGATVLLVTGAAIHPRAAPTAAVQLNQLSLCEEVLGAVQQEQWIRCRISYRSRDATVSKGETSLFPSYTFALNFFSQTAPLTGQLIMASRLACLTTWKSIFLALWVEQCSEERM